MNYYERHLGDYAKDTAHLTMIEHGAYTLLLDRCYSDESGIAAEDVYRVTRARTAAEKRAVDAALREFFIFCDGVWTHRRVEAEIKKFADKRRSSEANKEAVRLRQERAREKRKSLFSELKELGISMPWSATTEELNEAISGARSRHLSRTCHGDSHAPVTPPVTPPVTAYTIHQTPVYKDKSSKPPLPPLPVTAGLDVAAWDRWVRYRMDIRKPIKPASMQAAQEKLAGFGADQAAVVEQSIANGWQGLFELKAESPTPQRTRSIHDERAAVLAALSGSSGQHGARIIDITPSGFIGED